MHSRHTNRQQYFQEQRQATEKYIIPYIYGSSDKIVPNLLIAEVGCGFGGNLKPFLDRGCKVVGIDISSDAIQAAESFYENDHNRSNLRLIAKDIYQIAPHELPAFDLIFMRDVLEHIHHQEQFLLHIKPFLTTDGKLFVAFPPWFMPFGGHQQMCESKFLSKLPCFHILPKCLYRWILKLFGEDEAKINSLLQIKETKISIRQFLQIIKRKNFAIEKQTLWLINPNYEVKFGMRPRLLPRLLNTPFLREFFTTSCYAIFKQ